MIVHWPNGRRTRISAEAAASARVLADLCPRRDEHTPLPGPLARRGMVAVAHQPCGLDVVWRRR